MMKLSFRDEDSQWRLIIQFLLNLLPSLGQIFAGYAREGAKRNPAQRNARAIACSVVNAAPFDQANS